LQATGAATLAKRRRKYHKTLPPDVIAATGYLVVGVNKILDTKHSETAVRIQ